MSPHHVRKAILDVVNNQLQDNEPPETKQTYHRLLREGYSDKEARQLIGCVVSSEIFEVIQQGRTYDQVGFVAALKRLPVLPWE